MRTRFRDLDEYRLAKAEAKGEVMAREASLQGHWDLLGKPEFRHRLAANTALDMVQAWSPGKLVARFFSGNSGLVGNVLTAFVATKARTFKGKMMAWAASAILPVLMDKFLHSELLDRWLHDTEEEETDEADDVTEDEEAQEAFSERGS